MLSFSSVNKSFQQEVLFQNLEFDIKPGQKAVVTGESGCGKTTLLNMVLGFETVDRGQIKVHGLELDEHTVWKIRANTSFLSQYPVFDKGRVLENIEFPFSFKRNHTISPCLSTIQEHLVQTGLSKSILQKNIVDLSGGQRQRVALMVSKLLKRKLVLLDEPTSALDPQSKDLIIKYILEDPEVTVLSVSHDTRWIQKCDREIKL